MLRNKIFRKVCNENNNNDNNPSPFYLRANGWNSYWYVPEIMKDAGEDIASVKSYLTELLNGIQLNGTSRSSSTVRKAKEILFLPIAVVSYYLTRRSRSLKRLSTVLLDIKLILMPSSSDSNLVVVVGMLYFCYTGCTRNTILNKKLCTLVSLTLSRPFIEYTENFSGGLNENLPKKYEWLNFQLNICKPCTDLHDLV